MKDTIRKVKLEAELIVARGLAAGANAIKGKQLDDLIAEHGGAENVPKEKLGEWLGPMKEVMKSIRLTNAIMNLSKRFGLDFMRTQTTQAISLFINARLTEPDIYDIIKELHDGPDDKVRRGIYQLMLRLGDLNQRKIDFDYALPEKRAEFEAWLDGDIYQRDHNDPTSEEI